VRTATEPGAERRLAVLGSPIAHSKSPVLHAAAYRVLGLPWRYVTVEVTGDELGAFVASRDVAWRGLSLTMPLKQDVLPLVDELDGVARLTGAANTLLFDTDDAGERLLRGFNTDVAGIVRALRAAGVTTVRHAHVFGGGATAASAIVAAAELGAEQVSVGVRSPNRAEPLAGLARSVGLTAVIGRFDDEPPAVPDLVISTLPGSIGSAADGLLSGDVLGAAPDAGAALFDVAYDPWPSPIAAAWRRLAAGRADADTSDSIVLSGLPMLVHQALLQVRIFVGGDPLQPLEHEEQVLRAMLTAVDLDASGRPSGGADPAGMPES
jgi:Shikimate 5-dehydrogenase